MPYANLSDLAIKLRDAYDDLCQCLSLSDNPDRQPENVTLSAPVEVAPPSVELRGRGEPPLVLGNAKPLLTVAQYDVIGALLEAGDGGLNKDDLEIKGKHSDARRILKRLSKSDPDWAKVISLPGGTGKRYRLV
jgi:hypothetical protein